MTTTNADGTKHKEPMNHAVYADNIVILAESEIEARSTTYTKPSRRQDTNGKRTRPKYLHVAN